MTLLYRLLGGVAALVFLLAVFAFAALAFGMLIVGALVAGGWLWWRSRSLPRSEIIEGEYRDVTHLERLEKRAPPPL